MNNYHETCKKYRTSKCPQNNSPYFTKCDVREPKIGKELLPQLPELKKGEVFHKLNFYKVKAMREIVDDIYNPFVNMNWIPESDIKNLITKIQVMCLNCELGLKACEDLGYCDRQISIQAILEILGVKPFERS